MNESISAEELDLLTFFEVEPKMREVDIPWLYNDSVYEVVREDLHLSFAVAPSYKDVRIILKRGEHLLYELNAMDVEDIRYHNEKDREILEIRLNDRDRLWLRVKPAITIAHQLERET